MSVTSVCRTIEKSEVTWFEFIVCYGMIERVIVDWVIDWIERSEIRDSTKE